MDRQILFTLAAIIIIVAAIIGFRMLTTEDCVPPEIAMEPANPVAGQLITFKNKVEGNSAKINWNFGDGQTFTGTDAIHKYDSMGVYTVKATIEEGCENQTSIRVMSARKMEIIKPAVAIPSVIRTGESITFRDETREADKWSWKVKETEETGNNKTFTTIFKTPGKYIIRLVVNGTYINGDTTFMVNVLKKRVDKWVEPVVIAPKPVPPPKPKPEPKPSHSEYLKDEEFRGLFIQLANSFTSDDENDAGDKWRDRIVTQCCTEETMIVDVVDEQNERKQMSLEKFKLKQLASHAYTVTDVKITFRGKNSCIGQIKVTVQNN